jgi:hypothetical protein
MQNKILYQAVSFRSLHFGDIFNSKLQCSVSLVHLVEKVVDVSVCETIIKGVRNVIFPVISKLVPFQVNEKS